MYIVVIVLRSDPTHVFKHSVKIASNIVQYGEAKMALFIK